MNNIYLSIKNKNDKILEKFWDKIQEIHLNYSIANDIRNIKLDFSHTMNYMINNLINN